MDFEAIQLNEKVRYRKIGGWAFNRRRKYPGEIVGYPTQKPLKLLDRIVKVSSNAGDIILDAFAGSGTTGAVAEKLGRKWIMIDSSKLAIYTMQKRMLNLKTEIGNKGKALKPKPFVLYNAGLYLDSGFIEKWTKQITEIRLGIVWCRASR